jgi:hypothetical protein
LRGGEREASGGDVSGDGRRAGRIGWEYTDPVIEWVIGSVWETSAFTG